jgi:acetylglutamate kinase
MSTPIKYTLIKIGGSVAVDQDCLEGLALAISELKNENINIILVHGGGKDINENLSLLKEKPLFRDGLRVTEPTTLKMVEMTLSGHVNKLLVRLLLSKGCNAVGISGVDGGLFKAVKKTKPVDLGLVGDIEVVNTKLIEHLSESGWTPVVSPISLSSDFESLNVNADNAASALGVALKAHQLLFISDVPGVMKEGDVIPTLNAIQIKDLQMQGIISGGMIPKTDSALELIKSGLKSVHIIGWKDKESLKAQILEQHNYGTIIS